MFLVYAMDMHTHVAHCSIRSGLLVSLLLFMYRIDPFRWFTLTPSILVGHTNFISPAGSSTRSVLQTAENYEGIHTGQQAQSSHE